MQLQIVDAFPWARLLASSCATLLRGLKARADPSGVGALHSDQLLSFLKLVSGNKKTCYTYNGFRMYLQLAHRDWSGSRGDSWRISVRLETLHVAKRRKRLKPRPQESVPCWNSNPQTTTATNHFSLLPCNNLHHFVDIRLSRSAYVLC